MQRSGKTQDWRVSRSWAPHHITQGLFLQPWDVKDTETVSQRGAMLTPSVPSPIISTPQVSPAHALVPERLSPRCG